MTIPSERYSALKHIRPVLITLATSKGPIRKRELRHLVRWLLRHYPTDYEIDEMAKKCPRLLEIKR